MWPCNVSRSDFAGLVFAEHGDQHVRLHPVLEFNTDPIVFAFAGIVARALDGPLVPWLDALVASGMTDLGIHNVANFQTANLQGCVSRTSGQRGKTNTLATVVAMCRVRV